ncbi:MAG TPA: hypothetical protein VG096_06530 [Bryobacteraceae bacterium]|jgi:hypothetical protein|nr:hypothetical protein [Bryobacteraceae bacterium]
MKYQSPFLVTVYLFFVFAAFGQGLVTVAGGGSAGHFSSTASFMLPPFLPPAVMGAPYSGEETHEHIQTLSDGTHITQPMMMNRTMYRDSFGRTREERTMGPPARRANMPPQPIIVEITDPAAGVHYLLDTEHKVAHRVTVQAQPAGGRTGTAGILRAGPVSPSPSTSPNGVIRTANLGPEVTVEKLGTQIIEGVAAEGERNTTTIPEGEQGNDRAFHVTMETWTSPDLKIVVLQKSSDPRSGETITKITNLSRLEPDPSLFQPPPDYTIVDETGQFTIHYDN